MGTKRFILTENERKNILNLYNYKGILKPLINEEDHQYQQKAKTEYFDWCSKDLNPQAKNKNLDYKDIAEKILDSIEGTGTYKESLKGHLNRITYCGDLIAVGKEYKIISGNETLYDGLVGDVDDQQDWGRYVQVPLNNIKERTKKYIDNLKNKKYSPQQIEDKCGSGVSDILNRGFMIVTLDRYNELRADTNYYVKKQMCTALNRDIYFAKKKNVVVPPPPPGVTQQAGGGGMPIGVTNTNMKNDDNTYWNTLAMKLEDNGLQIKTGGLDFVDTPTFKIGKYTINRDTRPFIVYEIDVDNKIEANLAKMGNATPQRYSGEDLSSVRLLLLNDPKGRERVSLEEFLGTKQKPQQDNTDQNRNQNRNQNRQRKRVVSSRYKLDTDGTYSLYSKSPKIAEVQRCLGLTGDGMMGPRTVNAVKAKLGKTSFTDADVATLCSGSQSNNNSNNNANNNSNNNAK